ncbi:MAG TPA: YihY family inner membrane protein [Burkholderiales bacterium]|jgi:membrane protein|nr:YihY family inner membrane protein [Burkholderiales bacterium]
MKLRLRSLLDIVRQFKLLANFIVLVYRRFKEERCFQLCGSLTFTTLLALVPLVTIMLTVMTAFPVFDDILETLRRFVTANLVPEASSNLITVYMQQFAENAARLTALGIVLLGVTSIMLMLTIDRAFNTIWRVKRPRPLIQRVLIYWSVLTVGPLLVGGSLSLTSWLVTQSMGLGKQAPELTIAVLRLVPLMLTSVAFGFLYRTVPNRQVTVLDAAVGGIIAAFAFEAMKIGFGHFVARVATYKLVYGTFASLPIFLMWIYLSWVVVVFAAVITAVLPYWRSGGVLLKQPPGAQFVEAVEILKLLYRAYADGRVLNLQQLRIAVKLSWEDAEAILDKLVAAGWVAKLQGNGWVLARDAGAIRVGDVFQMFVFGREAADVSEDSGIRRLVSSIAANVDGELDFTLKELLASSGGQRAARIA